jgi:kanamycin kinase
MRGKGQYRKFTREAPTEAATLAWLRAQGLPAAEVLDVGENWLITREIPGRTAAQWWPAQQGLRIVDALVEITRTLHAVPVGRLSVRPDACGDGAAGPRRCRSRHHQSR